MRYLTITSFRNPFKYDYEDTDFKKIANPVYCLKYFSDIEYVKDNKYSNLEWPAGGRTDIMYKADEAYAIKFNAMGNNQMNTSSNAGDLNRCRDIFPRKRQFNIKYYKNNKSS